VNASTLGTSCQELLDAFIDEMSQIQGFNVPPNSYVGAGDIPWDGEGVYLYLGGTFSGVAGRPQTTNIPAVQGVLTAITLYLMIIRAVPTFGFFTSGDPAPASDDQLNGAGVQSMNDAGALIIAAIAIKKAGNFTNSKQASFVIGATNSIGPEGGLAAVRLQLDISIEQP
jgi:hypothetical protein